MSIRTFGLSLALVGACSALAGCEELRHGLRSKSVASSEEAANASGVLDVKPEAPKGFFKSTRLPGAMSDEGREIEKSFGIQ